MPSDLRVYSRIRRSRRSRGSPLSRMFKPSLPRASSRSVDMLGRWRSARAARAGAVLPRCAREGAVDDAPRQVANLDVAERGNSGTGRRTPGAGQCRSAPSRCPLPCRCPSESEAPRSGARPGRRIREGHLPAWRRARPSAQWTGRRHHAYGRTCSSLPAVSHRRAGSQPDFRVRSQPLSARSAGTSLAAINTRRSWVTAAWRGPSRSSYCKLSSCSASGSVGATVRSVRSAPWMVMLAKSTPGMLAAADAVRASSAAARACGSRVELLSGGTPGHFGERRDRRPTSVAGHLAAEPRLRFLVSATSCGQRRLRQYLP